VAIYGEETWKLIKNTGKRLAVFERKVLRRMFVGITVNENWRKRYGKELMQLAWDLDILPFVRISQLNWIGHVSRTESKRKASQVFNNSPKGSQLRGRPKTNGGIVYKQMLINVKLQIGNRCKKQSWLG